jgi:PAS domain S-box-containing protein
MAEDTNSDSSYSLIASATRRPVGFECLARPSAAPIRTSEKWWFDDPKLQNALFEDAIENMDHGLSMFDRDNRIMVANRRFAEMYSLPPAVVVPGAHLLDLVKFAVKAGVFDGEAVIQGTIDTLKAMAHQKSVDRIWRVTSGRIIAFTISTLDGGRWLAVHKDITDEHDAKRKLTESEQRFRDFTSVASDWCWETDKDHKFKFFTDAFEAFTGISPKELLGRSRSEAPILEEDRPVVDAHIRDLAEHKPFKDLMFRIPNRFHGCIWIKTSGLPRFDKKGRFIGYRGSGANVTKEQERLEELETARAILNERTTQLVEAQRTIRKDWRLELSARRA